eukprot:COSAG06_NODE_4024_length_4649_cov_240.051209_4_plen_332_part_00
MDQVRAVRSLARSLAPLDGEPAAAPSARVRQPASLLDRRLLDSHRLNSRVVPPRLPLPAAHAPVAAAAATMPQTPGKKGKGKGKRKSEQEALAKKQRKEAANQKKVAEQEAIATMCELIDGMSWTKKDGTVPTLRQGECALCVAAASRDALADAPADAHTRAGHLIAGLLPLARVRASTEEMVEETKFGGLFGGKSKKVKAWSDTYYPCKEGESIALPLVPLAPSYAARGHPVHVRVRVRVRMFDRECDCRPWRAQPWPRSSFPRRTKRHQKGARSDRPTKARRGRRGWLTWHRQRFDRILSAGSTARFCRSQRWARLSPSAIGRPCRSAR